MSSVWSFSATNKPNRMAMNKLKADATIRAYKNPMYFYGRFWVLLRSVVMESTGSADFTSGNADVKLL